MKEKNLLELIFELGVLTKMRRTGPYHVGITNHETPAAHTFRASVLSYFLAKEENADADKVLKMCLIHDIPESRLLDQTFVQREFYSIKNKEERALEKQLRNLNGSEELVELFREFLDGKTKEACIVRDASILESLIEAKEYIQQGLEIMDIWFQNKEKELKTRTAKKLFNVLKKETICWWKQ